MRDLLAALFRQGGDLAQRELGRVAVPLGLRILAGLFLAAAIGFAVAGIFVAIARPLGPIAASFIMAGGSVVIAALLFAAAAMRSRAPRRPLREAEPADYGLPGEGPSGMAAVAAAFAFGLARGLTRRRRPPDRPPP